MNESGRGAANELPIDDPPIDAESVIVDPIFVAVDFATRAHSGQYRKGSAVPYIIHPLRVAKVLIEVGCDRDLVLAGILHDTVEDSDATVDDIRARFGPEVARLVAAATEPDKGASWEDRKRNTIDDLETAAEDVLLVASADKLDNIKTLGDGARRAGEEFWERFNRPRDLQAWYYRALADVISRRARREPLLTLARELARHVSDVFGEDADG